MAAGAPGADAYDWTAGLMEVRGAPVGLPDPIGVPRGIGRRRAVAVAGRRAAPRAGARATLRAFRRPS